MIADCTLFCFLVFLWIWGLWFAVELIFIPVTDPSRWLFYTTWALVFLESPIDFLKFIYAVFLPSSEILNESRALFLALSNGVFVWLFAPLPRPIADGCLLFMIDCPVSWPGTMPMPIPLLVMFLSYLPPFMKTRWLFGLSNVLCISGNLFAIPFVPDFVP